MTLKLLFNILASLGLVLSMVILIYEAHPIIGSSTMVIATLGWKYLWFKTTI